ncbi:hypothetical protein [Synechococcus sp. HK01-R]|uniref:hypothetical protein n=1 Tax=Synechococcus sp. HK01-R TaxID=2751171 RepID=UPI0016288424|nr:hypothetical protein [Synechococcus sp. HK01-R]QNG26186.1 hypothetical protein H0O21_07765 [Synechococcus sp. HK01-R]
MSIEICSLIPVDLRLAWAHEANDFTPWLASNLDRLRAAVGIDLVLEGTEVTVGPFSADILATDALTNERVLIENQLEQADHAHLGQILTYLAGLDARSVIWIAKAFRDEHLSAVRWLNNNTMDDFSFFAVEVSAVRIGDSPVAPLFSVVEKPNDWDRQLHQAAPGIQEDKPSRLAKEYWEKAFLAYPELQGVGRAGPGGSNVWIEIPNTHFILSLAYSVSSVGWFVRGGTGVPDSDVAEGLLPCRDCLAENLGIQINSSPSNSWSTLSEWQSLDMKNRDNWDEGIKWHSQRRLMVLEAFSKCIASPQSS